MEVPAAGDAMIPSLYLRITAYGLAALLFGSIGWFVNGDRWSARYEALIAGHAQELADAQAKAKEALQAQLEQFENTSANNAKVIRDLQTQTDAAAADSARDRDLVQRLLYAAAQGTPGPGAVPQAGHQSPVAQAGQPQGTERLGNLLIGTADESRACARQLNALLEELRPQL